VAVVRFPGDHSARLGFRNLLGQMVFSLFHGLVCYGEDVPVAAAAAALAQQRWASVAGVGRLEVSRTRLSLAFYSCSADAIWIWTAQFRLPYFILRPDRSQ
jgi:hypothetical protein